MADFRFVNSRFDAVLSFCAMVARDTSAHAARLQADIHRRFQPAERLEMAIEMSEFARDLTRAGLRSRHPELTPLEIERELTRRIYGVAPRRDG